MAKMKSGIIGGYKGTIDSVTGYRRNGKNILQEKNKYSSLHILPSFQTNAKNLTNLWLSIENFKLVFYRILFLRYGSYKLDTEKLVKENIYREDYSNIHYMPSLIISDNELSDLPLTTTQYSLATQLSKINYNNVQQRRILYEATKYVRISTLSSGPAIGLTYDNIVTNVITTNVTMGTRPLGTKAGLGVSIVSTTNALKGHFVFQANERV